MTPVEKIHKKNGEQRGGRGVKEWGRKKEMNWENNVQTRGVRKGIRMQTEEETK